MSVCLLSSLSKNGNSLLTDELFHRCLLVCLQRNVYFEMWDKPRIQPRRTADFIGSSVSLLTPFIALLLCTPKYIEGTMTLGEVVQAAAAFVIVQGAFNWITDSYGRISEWAASANRVASLLLALDQIDGQTSAVAGAGCNEFADPAATLTSD